MAQWPRRITRGRLKGQTFASESEYRKAYAQKVGITRHAQRNLKARALGYGSYAKRRRAQERVKENNPLGSAGKLLDEFRNTSKEARKAALDKAAAELGISPNAMYARFYRQVDAQRLR